MEIKTVAWKYYKLTSDSRESGENILLPSAHQVQLKLTGLTHTVSHDHPVGGGGSWSMDYKQQWTLCFPLPSHVSSVEKLEASTHQPTEQ